MKPSWCLTLTLCACAEAPPRPSLPPPPAETAPRLRTATAEPEDPAPVTKNDVTVAWWRGMQIIVKRMPGADLVAGHLYVKGGAHNWSATDAGVERLALAVAVSGGTKSLDKDAFSRRLARLGSTIDSASGNENSELTSKSLKENWPATFALLVDAFIRPALPPSEVELQRQRQLSALKHEQEDPDESVSLLLHHALWRGHPFDNRAIGTLDTVASLDGAKLEAHLSKLRETSRLLLVVAGDVDATVVVDQAKAAFATLPRGNHRDEPFPKPIIAEPRVEVSERKIPTNYVETICMGPDWKSPDFPAAIVTLGEILRSREFEEVRTKRNLAYAAGSYFRIATSLPRGGIYVTAVDPNTTFKVMLGELTRLRDTAVPEKELVGYRSVHLTHYLTGREGTDGQAALLAEAQLYGGDWELGQSLPERIRAVTASDVQNYAKKYLGRLLTVVLGDPAKIDHALFESL